ncbi:MAG: hypothetical protein RJA76_774 [Bacteroidota bacterium]|jgi:nitrite reductase (NO-forming)
MRKVLFIVCFILGFSFTKLHAQNPSIQRGKAIYATYCQSCHMEEGEGVESVFPPLAKTNRLGDVNKLVKIVRNGMSGEISVMGVKYNAEMSSVDLNDQELTDVLNYIRNSWGNKAPMIYDIRK